MLTTINAKFRSGVHRIRTKLYERSDAWRQHPLNPSNLPFDVDNTNWQRLDEDLRAWAASVRIPVVDFEIDALDYQDFKERANVPSTYAVGYKDKKILEHFVAYQLLGLDTTDRYLDVASEASPFPEIFRNQFGIDAYSQDLTYPAGIHGRMIGSSADSIPLPDGSVSKISLQCAFEHFEGPIDTAFMNEVRRLLRPQGRCVIVPLYLRERHLNIIDPLLVSDGEIRMDTGCVGVAETCLGGRFERMYSPESLSRIVVPNLHYTIYRIEGRGQIAPDPHSAVHRVRYALMVAKD